MGRKSTDSRVDADIALLARMRIKSTIDYFKWTDPVGLPLVPVEGSNRVGIWATLHNVNGKKLVGLPTEIQGRGIAGLEFAIDFVAKAKRLTNDDQDADLIAVYHLLHRRLAPWQGRFVSSAVRRSNAPNVYEPLVDRQTSGMRPGGEFWFRHTPPRFITPARHTPSGMRAYTVYFGDKPQPSWNNLEPQTPEVQVRLYIKVTDGNRTLPRKSWRTRVEVTLNGPPLDLILGVRMVRDLQNADMKKLVHEYLRLSSPGVDLGLVTPPLLAWKTMFERRMRHLADRNVAVALSRGNFAAVDDGLIKFRPVAELDKRMLACANDFRRSVQYAKR